MTQQEAAAFQPPNLKPGKAAPAGATVPAGATETPVPSCPKCHRPIEGDEQYICCASASLSWRCGGCGKVSDGFAFPYGMCMACGGKLAPLEERPIEGEAALKAVRAAFEIELGGMAFYTRAARETNEPVLRDLFTRFAQMEAEHMSTLSRRYHADVPGPSDEFKIERAAIYAGIPHRPEDPANLFRIAIAFEQRAVKFFTEAGAATPAGSLERQLYQELAAEEQEHVAILTTELQRYQEGKPGMM